MIVVSNASPIINLAAIRRLGLLRQLYGKIIVPQAVYHEIVIAGAGQPGAAQVEASDWIEPLQVSNRAMVSSFQLEVDQGEAEAIALAIELGANLLLLDERRGRIAASSMGLRFIGLLGILIEAKNKGLVPAVKPILDDLISRAGFWVTSELYARVLLAARE